MENKIVLKFGGSSVESIEKMQQIVQKIIRKKEKYQQIVVVVSAMGKTTNQLLDLAKQASKSPSKREMDMLISTGEQVSISLLTMILNEQGQPAIALTGFQAGIKTAGLHTKNKILDIDTSKIEKHLDSGKVVVVAGFQGFNEDGDITTLGRGGSDTTAVAIAAKLKCPAEIYTDVEGIYGVDPRLYPYAKKLDVISYEEMKEMAFLGAKVMEPRSIEIGQKYGVVIYVSSSLTENGGTYIKEYKKVEEKSITGLSISEKVMMVTIKNFPNHSSDIAALFILLADNEVNVDMISQTPTENGYINLSFTASADDLDAINEVLGLMGKKYHDIETVKNINVVKLSVVGSGMRTQSGVAADMFKLFADHNIDFMLVTTSEISISYTIDKKLMKKAVLAISEKFGL
ncbi:aspartate kinase [Peloplasma aerotolerans]|uniref:Aspartokinase n=1 Tax=Peloplasma aerotolerans TaxID=3044389 RepID=A0AAW6U3I9_9MOLU|nr:aspartate kinase [Mariniplasma sp. M4Ah]MDI6452445.1 aspartate kinase [Mariniplasma sp. M4Ah]